MNILESLFGPEVELVYQGTSFHRGDKVLTKNGGESQVPPDKSGHRVPVLVGDGRTGRVLKKDFGDLLLIEWDAQKWQEAGQRRGGKEVGPWVQIGAFKSTIHADYLDIDSARISSVDSSTSTWLGNISGEDRIRLVAAAIGLVTGLIAGLKSGDVAAIIMWPLLGAICTLTGFGMLIIIATLCYLVYSLFT